MIILKDMKLILHAVTNESTALCVTIVRSKNKNVSGRETPKNIMICTVRSREFEILQVRRYTNADES